MEDGNEDLVLESKVLLRSCRICYRTIRLIRKNVPRALTTWGFSWSAEASLASDALKNGIHGLVRDSLKTGLGKDRYKEIKTSPYTVIDKIYYCQRAVATLPSFLNPVLDSSKKEADAVCCSQRAVVSHDFLVLEILYTNGGNSLPEKLFVVAEKIPQSPRTSNIFIQWCSDFEKKASSVVLFSVSCGKKPLGLKELRSILANRTLDYDYMSENCWDYATKTAKKILQACQALPGISVEERERLRKEEKYLEGRIIRCHLSNVVEAVKRVPQTIFGEMTTGSNAKTL